ncbi:hypothetical protein RSOLAG1IB_08059 [Rhizoctonia solani AG-1 IB]|uniref:Uncharacterized protein n=1 Tax=Thanatephorus cucumeris (strain AG1-IB / isolate 7/3/14) TaxID=1108050 RepID=A0A0B7FKR4_THACB|nr:hypothetical protein RSOLAG1IB_08059 [Rhizoctonia solani AG-1 IB]
MVTAAGDQIKCIEIDDRPWIVALLYALSLICVRKPDHDRLVICIHDGWASAVVCLEEEHTRDFFLRLYSEHTPTTRCQFTCPKVTDWTMRTGHLLGV